MRKRKPYYLIIAALCFSVTVSFFLPFLKLPQQNGVTDDGYTIDITLAALNSKIAKDVSKETGIKYNIVYNTAKNIVNGKDRETIESRLKEDEYFIIDILSERLEEKEAELEKWGKLDTRSFKYFDMIKLASVVIKDFEQNTVSAYFVIITMIMTVILSYFTGFWKLFRRDIASYQLVKIISLINIALACLGLISINAVGIGALQAEKFYKENFGSGFLFIILINFLVLVVAIIGKMHESWEGIVTFKMILKQKELILLTLPFVIYVIVFNYLPLKGWIMAIQNYKPGAKSQLFVAWDKFKTLFKDVDFIMAFRNTIAMSLINLVFSFVFAIAFALLLNEVANIKGKKLVQTISYLPHFLSWIIVAAIVKNVLSVDGGIFNDLLLRLGLVKEPINFFAEPKYFWWIIGFSVIWKETGWNSIIYLASITSINPDLYEAASIDGAGRFKKMMHITLPGIRSTIMVLLIINLGMITNSGFEAQLQLKNDLIKSTAEVVDTYVLNKSFFVGADFSIGTAAGIFRSVISILLVSIANRIAKAFDQERLY